MSANKPKRGDDVLVEGMSKELRSLRRKNRKLESENKRLTQLLEQIKPMARLGAKVFSAALPNL